MKSFNCPLNILQFHESLPLGKRAQRHKTTRRCIVYRSFSLSLEAFAPIRVHMFEFGVSSKRSERRNIFWGTFISTQKAWRRNNLLLIVLNFKYFFISCVAPVWRMGKSGNGNVRWHAEDKNYSGLSTRTVWSRERKQKHFSSERQIYAKLKFC